VDIGIVSVLVFPRSVSDMNFAFALILAPKQADLYVAPHALYLQYFVVR